MNVRDALDKATKCWRNRLNDYNGELWRSVRDLEWACLNEEREQDLCALIEFEFEGQTGLEGTRWHRVRIPVNPLNPERVKIALYAAGYRVMRGKVRTVDPDGFLRDLPVRYSTQLQGAAFPV